MANIRGTIMWSRRVLVGRYRSPTVPISNLMGKSLEILTVKKRSPMPRVWMKIQLRCPHLCPPAMLFSPWYKQGQWRRERILGVRQDKSTEFLDEWRWCRDILHLWFGIFPVETVSLEDTNNRIACTLHWVLSLNFPMPCPTGIYS